MRFLIAASIMVCAFLIGVSTTRAQTSTPRPTSSATTVTPTATDTVETPSGAPRTGFGTR